MEDNNIRGLKQRGIAKTAKIPIKIVPLENRLKKPKWIRSQIPNNKRYFELKNILREHKLHTVCEEASCPNIGECFSKGVASFMIMGDICTRRCPFCDVSHGRPNPLDINEPHNLANTIFALNLRYVVITSVDRDDLRDGGANHFIECIKSIKSKNSDIKVEILVPDFRGRLDKALDILSEFPPDVLNHNLETIPRLYKKVRPGSDYNHSLSLLKKFKDLNPQVITKSGIMVGLGEDFKEIIQVMEDLRYNKVDMITIGQYLQPSEGHLPVLRYITPEEFKYLENFAYSIGFKHAAVGAMVRSSYHADEQSSNLVVMNDM